MAETPRKKRSSLWNVFNDCGEGRASCKICEQKLSYKSSTTNLKKHLDRKHQNIIITSESISPNIVLEIEGKGDKNTKTEDIETSDYSRVNNSSKSNSPVKSETLYLVMESDSSPTTDKTSLREHRVQKSKPTRYNVPSSKIVSEENSNFLETEKIVSAVEKLDNISKRVASFDSSSEKQDSFDHFGKYISSVLRDLPRSKAFSLQADIVSMVMKTTSEPPAEEKLTDFKMKFLVLFLATAALASASLIGRKAVDVQEDGTIIIKGENGKQILISKEYGPYGQKNIEIEVTGPNTVTKKIQIDDQNQVNIEHGVEYHIPSTYDDVRSFEVNRYRRSFMDQSQNDIFSEIVREYQGVVDEESYQELLDQVQKAVVQGRISSNVLYFLQALNEYSNELLSSGYGYNNLYTKNNNNYYGKGVYEQQKYGRFFKNLFFQGQQGVMYHQDSQQFLRNVLIQIFDQRYLFNYLSQQGVFYRGTYEQESLENVLEYFLNNQGIFDKTFLIELLNTPVLRNILVEEGIFNKSIVQQIMYVFSTQRTYDQELLEQLVNKQALKYQLINQGIFQNYVFTQFVVKDVLTTGLYQNEFYGQEQLVQMVKNRALRQILVQQGIFNENVVYKLLVALKSQRSYTQTLLSQLVNKQVLRNILIQQGIVDYTVLDQLVNNEIMGLNVLLKTKFYQQTPRTSYKQLFGFASNLPEFSYGQIQGYPYGQNFVGINFEKTIVKPVDQEYQREFYPTEYNRFNPWFYGQTKTFTGMNKMDYLRNIIYKQQGETYQGYHPTQGFQGYYAQYPGYYNYQGNQRYYGQYPVVQQQNY